MTTSTTTTSTNKRRSSSSSSTTTATTTSTTTGAQSSSSSHKRKRESCGRPRKEQQAYIFESYTALVNAASAIQDHYHLQQQQQQQQSHHHHIGNDHHTTNGSGSSGSGEGDDEYNTTSASAAAMMMDAQQAITTTTTTAAASSIWNPFGVLEQLKLCADDDIEEDEEGEESDDDDDDYNKNYNSKNGNGLLTNGDNHVFHNGNNISKLVEEMYEHEFVNSKFDKYFEKEEKLMEQQQQQQSSTIPSVIICQYRKSGGVDGSKRRRISSSLTSSTSSSWLEEDCYHMRYDQSLLYQNNDDRLNRLFGDVMSFSYQQARMERPSIPQFLVNYKQEQQLLSKELHDAEESLRRQRQEQIAANRRARAKSAPKSIKDQFQKSRRRREMCLNLALQAQKRIMELCNRTQQQRKSRAEKAAINATIATEIEAFWKKHEKAQVERVKKASREEAERREKERQDRKLNFLLTQTELYSHFMAKKNTGADGSVDKNELVVQELQDDEFESAKQRALKASSAERERLDHFSDNSSVVDEYQTTSSEIVTEPKGFHGKLKKYQFQALNWLVNLYDQGINGMLCDEMGLGKTVQTIAFLTYINNVHKPKYPFLIITPTTTLHNWLSEFTKFSPQLKVLPYWGGTQQRKVLRAGIKDDEYNVILSSYGMIIEDFKTMSKHKFHFLVLDEAHAIKSSESVRWKRLLELDVRGRMLLTGTPIQNHLGELWALLHFVMPKLFDNRNEFEEWFTPEGVKGKKKNLNKVELDEMQLQRLHMILRPFMLRRLKTEVESELAPKEEMVLHCEVNKQQKEAYIDIRNTVVSHRKSLNKKNNTRALFNTVMQLRKICNHPYLFLDGEKEIPPQFIDMASNHQIRGLDFSSPYIFKEPLPFRESDPLVMPSMRNPIKFELPRVIYWEMMAESGPIMSNRFCREAARELPYTVPVNTVSFINRELKGDILNDMREELVERVSLRYTPRVHELVSAKVASPPIEENCSVIRHSLQQQALLRPVFVEHRNILRHPEVWNFVAQCSKMRLLDGILNQLRIDPEPENRLPNKVLIFCQMTRMLDLLETYCTMKNYSFMRMDGSTPVQVREGFVQKFQSTEDRTFIFLLSTRAGGIGINLTRANHVIFYDCDWNPTLDSQAMDRVHRIGQKRKVTVMRLVNKNTVEERILQIAGLKMDIQSMVYKGSKIDKDDIDVRQLLLMDLDSQL